MCSIRCAWVALIFCSGSTAAENAKNPTQPNPNEVEIRLADGSRLRMLMLQEQIEIETKYGKLTAPTSDVRRIEFGVKPAVAHQVEEAVKRLGDSSFQERENAMKELVAAGAPAYRALRKAANSKDAEIAQRARTALGQLRQKFPENKLQIREEDLVQTAGFTIAGRILNPTLRVKSAILAETQLNTADLVGIRWLSKVADVELEMEATKYAVNPGQWLDTGIAFLLDEGMVITASGQLNLGNGPGPQSISGPEGLSPWHGQGTHPPGALLGRIGENGDVFLIGTKYTRASRSEGNLYLQIVASPYARTGTVSGSYTVKLIGGQDMEGNR
jgi:hypothetical protein